MKDRDKSVSRGSFVKYVGRLVFVTILRCCFPSSEDTNRKDTSLSLVSLVMSSRQFWDVVVPKPEATNRKDTSISQVLSCNVGLRQRGLMLFVRILGSLEC